MSQNQNNDKDNSGKKVEWFAILVSLFLGISSLVLQGVVVLRQEQLIQIQNSSNREFSSGHLEVSCLDTSPVTYDFPNDTKYLPSLGSSCADGIQIRNSGLSTAKNVVAVIQISNYSSDYGVNSAFTDDFRNYNLLIDPAAMERHLDITKDEVRYNLETFPSGNSFTFYMVRTRTNLVQFDTTTNLTIYSSQPDVFDDTAFERYFYDLGAFASIDVSMICNDSCIDETTYKIPQFNTVFGNNSLLYDFSLFEGVGLNSKISHQQIGKWYKWQAEVNISYLLPKGFRPPSTSSSLILIDKNSGTDNETITECDTICAPSTT